MIQSERPLLAISLRRGGCKAAFSTGIIINITTSITIIVGINLMIISIQHKYLIIMIIMILTTLLWKGPYSVPFVISTF